MCGPDPLPFSGKRVTNGEPATAAVAAYAMIEKEVPLRRPIGDQHLTEPLPEELERRIRLLESGAQTGADFDAASWCWMVLLGIALPILLLLWGWFG